MMKHIRDHIIFYEVKDLNAEERTKVSFSIPTDNSPNKSGIQQLLFSNGTQVLDQKPYNQPQRRRKKEGRDFFVD